MATRSGKRARRKKRPNKAKASESAGTASARRRAKSDSSKSPKKPKVPKKAKRKKKTVSKEGKPRRVRKKLNEAAFVPMRHESSKTSIELPTREEIAAALVHFAAVAAVIPDEPSGVDDFASERLVSDVVRLLLSHKQQNRSRSLDWVRVQLADGLADIYAAMRSGRNLSSSKAALLRLLKECGFKLESKDDPVIAKASIEEHAIVRMGGPVDAAYKVTAQLLGGSARTIRNIATSARDSQKTKEMDSGVFPFRGIAFGRAPSQATTIRHFLSLFGIDRELADEVISRAFARQVEEAKRNEEKS